MAKLYPRPRWFRMIRGFWVSSPSFSLSRRTHILTAELSMYSVPHTLSASS